MDRADFTGVLNEQYLPGHGKSWRNCTVTISYAKGYTVNYTGTVSRIVINKTRYAVIFEGTPLHLVEPVELVESVTEIPAMMDIPNLRNELADGEDGNGMAFPLKPAVKSRPVFCPQFVYG